MVFCSLFAFDTETKVDSSVFVYGDAKFCKTHCFGTPNTEKNKVGQTFHSVRAVPAEQRQYFLIFWIQ